VKVYHCSTAYGTVSQSALKQGPSVKLVFNNLTNIVYAT